MNVITNNKLILRSYSIFNQWLRDVILNEWEVFQAAYEKDYASSVGDVDNDMAALLEEEFLQEISRG